MNLKSRPWIIGGIIVLLFVVGLIIVLENRGGGTPAAPITATPVGATTTPGAAVQTTAGTTAVPGGTATPGDVTQNVSRTTAVAATDETAAVSPAEPGSTPIATLTAKEAELLTEMQSSNSQTVASRDQCDEKLKTEGGCNVVQSVQQITRPEWEQLLPETRFYLGEYDRYAGSEGPQTRHFLIVEQDGQRYTPETYDLLLTANHIVLTNENRELVAKAWALMTIEDFLGDEVNFTAWEPDKDPLYASSEFYNLKGWARWGGAELSWSFAFASVKYELITIGPRVLQWWVGDFSGTPDDVAMPLKVSFYFFPVR